MAGQPENVVVIQPELANDDEADEPAQELREQIKQLMAEFARAAMIVQGWDFEFERQQGDDNREDPSLNASIRVRRNWPRANRFNKRIR